MCVQYIFVLFGRDALILKLSFLLLLDDVLSCPRCMFATYIYMYVDQFELVLCAISIAQLCRFFVVLSLLPPDHTCHTPYILPTILLVAVAFYLCLEILVQHDLLQWHILYAFNSNFPLEYMFSSMWVIVMKRLWLLVHQVLFWGIPFYSVQIPYVVVG